MIIFSWFEDYKEISTPFILGIVVFILVSFFFK